MGPAAAAGDRVGRFELRRLLGRGAQASVWLAHDPRLEREVALKLLDVGDDLTAADNWLAEARSVSRLTHPNVVPVFEADRDGGRPYLVFEYVPGPTLAQLLRERGALPAREAVTLMLGILDALAAAHAHGIVHRDLKPSNVLVGDDGRPRVMDFGIAARLDVGDAFRGTVVGTPGYLSPEGARGEPPAPPMDLFSAGIVLGEMLGGQRLLAERDARRAIERVQREDLAVRATAAVDDALRTVVRRALEREPTLRWRSATEFQAALARWLDPDAGADATPVAAGHGTLDFLLRRMRHKGDFPALSDAVVRIQRVASSETESLGRLSAEILKDVALTNRLLRLVNTAHFSAAGGAVSTVSRAVALVGFGPVRDMALSLVLLEHMRDKAHAGRLREEFLRALMAGTLADELTLAGRDGEEAFLGAMFQNLGRLLVEYYFPEEADRIRARLPDPDAPAAARDAAAARVLGIGFDELGHAIARAWGLPETLQQAMRLPSGEVPARPVAGAERQRWAGRAANEIVDALLALDGPAADARVAAIAERYAGALALAPREVAAVVDAARHRLAEMAPAMGLQSAGRARRLLRAAAPDPGDSLSPLQLQSVVREAGDGAAEPASGAMAELLAAGIHDVTSTMVAEDFRLDEVLRMVLETMYRALGFRRVVFCLRDARGEALTGRFGLGDGADAAARAFRVALRVGPKADLFGAVCARGVDTLIADATAPNIAGRLPAWWREQVAAGSFLLLPMMLKGASFALIYADYETPNNPGLGEKELSLLRTLRNQAVMAFRQRGGGPVGGKGPP